MRTLHNQLLTSPTAPARWNDSAKSNRTLRLSTTLVASLRAHRLHQLEERMLAGPAWEDHDLRFATMPGHSQIGIAMDTYAHIAMALGERGSDRIESLPFGTNAERPLL